MMRQFVQCTSVQNRLGSPAFTAASASRVSSCSDPNPGTTMRSAIGNGARHGARRVMRCTSAVYSAAARRGAPGSKRAKRWNWTTARPSTKHRLA